MNQSTLTATDYIQHHLKHLQFTFYGESGGFYTINVDTLFFSVAMGALFLVPFSYCARRLSFAQPGRFQAALELLTEFVDQQIQDTFASRVTSVCALALTIFVWVFLMNFMDLIPVDLFPVIASYMGIEKLRAVPTADLNMTLALALCVFLAIYYYAIAFNGFTTWLKEIATEPFGVYLMPVNILKHLIADIARPISLSLRLFGNIYAGEIIFILIALTPAYMQWLLAGAWLGFHLFVITIQAFIFMILTIVYIGLVKHTGDNH
jgi:F-type H+-transporting ATPase subunit a